MLKLLLLLVEPGSRDCWLNAEYDLHIVQRIRKLILIHAWSHFYSDPLLPILPSMSRQVGAIYGNGTYFARDAKYSDDYAARLGNGSRQMLLCFVIVGKWVCGRLFRCWTMGLSGLRFRRSRLGSVMRAKSPYFLVSLHCRRHVGKAGDKMYPLLPGSDVKRYHCLCNKTVVQQLACNYHIEREFRVVAGFATASCLIWFWSESVGVKLDVFRDSVSLYFQYPHSFTIWWVLTVNINNFAHYSLARVFLWCKRDLKLIQRIWSPTSEVCLF